MQEFLLPLFNFICSIPTTPVEVLQNKTLNIFPKHTSTNGYDSSHFLCTIVGDR